MNYQTRTTIRIAFAAAAGWLLAGMLSACGSSGGDGGGPATNPGYDTAADTGEDADGGTPVDGGVDGEIAEDSAGGDGGGRDTDTGNSGTECGEVRCQPNEVCLQEECVSEAVAKCSTAPDRGVLGVGETLTITGTFDGEGATNALSTSCAGRDMVPEKVYKFEVAESSRLDLSTDWPSGFDAKVEFRRGSCREASSEATTCRDRDDPVWVEGGTEVSMVVENDSGGTGEFEIDLTASSAPCRPRSTSCASSSSVELCRVQDGSPTPVELSCPTTCSSGSCAGTSCSNPIEVAESERFTGDLGAFDAPKNFKNASNCGVGSSSGAEPDSRGSEVIFSVEMEEGETLTVDTSNDDLDNLIFVTGSCESDVSEMSCLASADQDSSGADKLSGWTAPSPGTYFVFVDKWSFTQGAFDYEFQIE